jgi:hypothetical protein
MMRRVVCPVCGKEGMWDDTSSWYVAHEWMKGPLWHWVTKKCDITSKERKDIVRSFGLKVTFWGKIYGQTD